MSERFFVDSPLALGRVTLQGPEAHHAARVMRARPGDRVVLFDGSGDEYAAEVLQVGRSRVELQVIESRKVRRELPNELTLGVALPRGDRQRWLVEKAVELGVTELVPLIAERSVLVPAESTSSRLARAVIEACKQCGRNRLMRVSPPQALTSFLNAAPAAASRLFAHPLSLANSETGSEVDRRHSIAKGHAWPRLVERPVIVAIGPEGGFTDAELAAARDLHWQLVDLGPRVLRVETAAVAIVAAIALGSLALGPRCDP